MLRSCRASWCSELVNDTYCTSHAAQYDASLGRPGYKVYRSLRWKGLRRQVLGEQRGACAVPGCLMLATDVDHIVAVRDGGELWGRGNLQGLCTKHHSAKTMAEVFGRK
jgi:5-methylcytosine-specific restriction endonuclease McrA